MNCIVTTHIHADFSAISSGVAGPVCLGALTKLSASTVYLQKVDVPLGWLATAPPLLGEEQVLSHRRRRHHYHHHLFHRYYYSLRHASAVRARSPTGQRWGVRFTLAGRSDGLAHGFCYSRWCWTPHQETYLWSMWKSLSSFNRPQKAFNDTHRRETFRVSHLPLQVDS